MIEHRKIRSTTILGVRSKGKVAVAGDGQVTLGDMAMKQKAVKVRKFDSRKGAVVGGFAGAAADPNCQSLSGLRRRLERKKEAGARFLQTQMVMKPAVLEHFCNEVANPLGLPVLAGVFLLKSARNASFINRVVPGACIPESLVVRLEEASDPMAEGIAIAAEQVRSYLSLTQGVHLMAVKAEERIPEILDQAGISLVPV